MSCRRQDRRRLIGCNIGDVGVRGCGRGCCPYGDEDIFEETHLILSTSYPPSTTYTPTEDDVTDRIEKGRTGLRWNKCGGYHYRPKFVCLDCRRVFKPFFEESKLEFDTGREGWKVRPRPEHNKLFCHAQGQVIPSYRSESQMRRINELISRLEETEDGGAWGRGIEFWHRIERGDEPETTMIYTPQSSVNGDNVEPLSNVELVELLGKDPYLWWQSIVTLKDHKKSCPSCGRKGIRIGSTFRPPPQKDDKGWKHIARLYEDGEDLNAHFAYCTTFDDFREMENEARRLAGRKANTEDWNKEKHRRLETLGLVDGVVDA